MEGNKPGAEAKGQRAGRASWRRGYLSPIRDSPRSGERVFPTKMTAHPKMGGG